MSQHAATAHAILLEKLVQATFDDHPDRAREALANGADPFARHGDGRSPMRLAAELGLTKILFIFIEHHRKTSFPDAKALSDEQCFLSRLRLGFALSPGFSDCSSSVAVFFAGEGDLVALSALHAGAIPLDPTEPGQFTPAMAAASEGRLDALIFLDGLGVAFQSRGLDGLSAADLAARGGHGECQAFIEAQLCERALRTQPCEAGALARLPRL